MSQSAANKQQLKDAFDLFNQVSEQLAGSYQRLQNQVVSLNRNTGELQWETKFDDVISAPPLIVGHNVFVGTLGEELVGMNVSSGEVTWRTELDGRVKSAMAVADGGLLVLTEPKWVMYFKPAGSSEDSESGTEATE